MLRLPKIQTPILSLNSCPTEIIAPRNITEPPAKVTDKSSVISRFCPQVEAAILNILIGRHTPRLPSSSRNGNSFRKEDAQNSRPNPFLCGMDAANYRRAFILPTMYKTSCREEGCTPYYPSKRSLLSRCDRFAIAQAQFEHRIKRDGDPEQGFRWVTTPHWRVLPQGWIIREILCSWRIIPLLAGLSA